MQQGLANEAGDARVRRGDQDLTDERGALDECVGRAGKQRLTNELPGAHIGRRRLQECFALYSPNPGVRLPGLEAFATETADKDGGHELT